MSIVLKILSGNEIPTLILKGHTSVINLRKMTRNNPNLDLVNLNANTKFGIITLVNVNAPVVATTSWWLHFSALVVA